MAIFWHSNGNFPEGQDWTQARVWGHVEAGPGGPHFAVSRGLVSFCPVPRVSTWRARSGGSPFGNLSVRRKKSPREVVLGKIELRFMKKSYLNFTLKSTYITISGNKVLSIYGNIDIQWNSDNFTSDNRTHQVTSPLSDGPIFFLYFTTKLTSYNFTLCVCKRRVTSSHLNLQIK